LLENLKALLRLQEVDGLIRAATAEAAAIPERRKLANDAREREREAADAARDVLAREEHDHRQLEAQLGDIETLIARLDRQLYEVTSKQAHEALQSELAHAREKKSGLEDEILTLLEAIDEASELLAKAEAAQREGEQTGTREEGQMVERERALESELEELAAERAARSVDVEAAVLGVYAAVLRRRWLAVVQATGESCPACHISIPAQRLLEIRASKSLVQCMSCERILYGDKVVAH